MNPRLPSRYAILLLGAAACASPELESSSPLGLDRNPPLADRDVLLGGAPDKASIERLQFAAAVKPKSHSALREFQSPVKSQGKRGVCSIFSTAALMEHLYIKEGTIKNPDFSEQYLQWSAKFEVGSFPATSGSSAFYNLAAIKSFGIVEEYEWPYEIAQWNVDNDPACDGTDEQPTHCYTNGHPTDEIKASHKFFLPTNKALHPLDIKSHILSKGTGVVVGFDFFYQAWNHRLSTLPTSEENWAKGIVLYPNDTDVEKSLEERAGHSILIIGWDDEMEVARRDENGDVMVDEEGEPVMEKGFYLFKNSWGTNSFGIDHPHGAGYGWVSQKYMHEYADARIAGLPKNITLPPEECDDGHDNDHDGLFDCQDDVCAATALCLTDPVDPATEVVLSGAGGSIPDDDQIGLSLPLAVEQPGTVVEAHLDLDIGHSYRGDLLILVKKGEKVAVVLDREGGSDNDVVGSFVLPDFAGEPVAGNWELVVIDTAALDVGTVNSWTLRATVQ